MPKVSPRVFDPDAEELAESNGKPNGDGYDAGDASPQASPKPKKKSKKPAKSQADSIVSLANAGFTFVRSPQNEVFAVAKDGPNLAIPLRGGQTGLRSRLASECRKKLGFVPSSTAIADALAVIEGDTVEANHVDVHLRLARFNGDIVLDMGTPCGKAVIVGPGRWHVTSKSPVLFRRTALTNEYPEPEEDGKLLDIREILNVSDDSWETLVGWMVSALIPDIPHCLLLLRGNQGTGKSCATKMLMQTIDPTGVPLRCQPGKIDDWHVAAAGSWAIGLDNLSSIPIWLSDALCRASTGEGLVKRQLYSNGELFLLSYRRVIAMTAIDAGSLRGDLGERILLTDLDVIEKSRRQTEADIERIFSEIRGSVFGGLLTALANTLAELPDVVLEEMPRMADFTKVLAAADAALVTDDAQKKYLAQQGMVNQDVIDGDSFASEIVSMAKAKRHWEGTATELLHEVGEEVTVGGMVVRKPRRGHPKPESVAGALRRLAPVLETVGVTVYVPNTRTKKGRLLGVYHAGK